MKKLILMLAMGIVGTSAVFAQDEEAEPQATLWNFVSVPDADASAIAGDSRWITDSKNRLCFTPGLTDEPAAAGGKELAVTAGLRFTVPANADGNLRLGGTTASLWLGDQCKMIIPDAVKGRWVEVEYMTSKSSATRTPTATNLVTPLPFTSGKTHVTAQSKIAADGNVEITVPGGLYFYRLVVGDSLAIFGSGGGTTSPGNPDNPNDVTHDFDITQDFSLLHTGIFGTGPRIYVAPDGDDSADGSSQEKALRSIQLAVDKAVDPGTTIILAPGEYRPTARINIDDRNGTHDNYNSMVCLDGRAVINCDHPAHGHSNNPYQGVRLTSSYWYFYHIDITNASDNGMLIERNKPTGGSSSDIAKATGQGHDNIIEACNFYRNGDTGLQMKNLAEYNYVINCDSYLNCDEGEGDADGFAPKISVGTGNYFFGCRAYLNSDDGWDVFYKKDGAFGDNQTIIIDNCISYKNGFLDENTVAPNGNGNGFKCGSDQGAMNVYMNRSLAVCNKAKGFDQNHNSGDIIMNNCTGMTLTSIGSKAYSYRIYEAINTADGHRVELTNCIAINDNDLKDKRDKTGATKPTEHGKQGGYGRFQVDETLAGLTVTNCEFHKASPELFESVDHTQLIAPRDADDNLPEMTFAHIKKGATAPGYNSATLTSAALIDTGKPVTAIEYQGLPVPEIKYLGSAPDLGAYETAPDATAIGQAVADILPTGKARTIVTASGRIVIKVDGGAAYNTAGQRVK
ncbi:MAG: right-handed parallel beta-helix repeat-containing protein [Bacteroidales bacterium]|nr:right-handed parallel beta-helix repeat-containing protein [Bacteroidales bacterium]MCM1146783.1 right-handed parallel beta-helix repeat-containing protein [Bacteroidales bacterium]MCM1205720.1 right-handed parallel beta-helix repeat-containing protein [Bacillota bacterium]MCM1510750.1 right-handed parallel beta-helix repeat-containing protein [Clostridium sp.]